ncbi:MAG: transcriptional regulator [Aurantimonas sp.]|nr:transcriptional regulator [Aurantimonas sp.]
MVIDGRQIKAARAILGWTVRETADASGVHRNSVIRVESETTFPRHAWAADKIASAMEAAGISFDQTDEGLGVSFEAPRYRKGRRYTRPAPDRIAA